MAWNNPVWQGFSNFGRLQLTNLLKLCINLVRPCDLIGAFIRPVLSRSFKKCSSGQYLESLYWNLVTLKVLRRITPTVRGIIRYLWVPEKTSFKKTLLNNNYKFFDNQWYREIPGQLGVLWSKQLFWELLQFLTKLGFRLSLMWLVIDVKNFNFFQTIHSFSFRISSHDTSKKLCKNKFDSLNFEFC